MRLAPAFGFAVPGAPAGKTGDPIGAAASAPALAAAAGTITTAELA